jgi:HK97 family phage major capsid protein
MNKKPLIVLPVLAFSLTFLTMDASPLDAVHAKIKAVAADADKILAGAKDGLSESDLAKVKEYHGMVDGLKATAKALETQSQLGAYLDSVPDSEKRKVILDASGLSNQDASDAERFSFRRLIVGQLAGGKLSGAEAEMVQQGAKDAVQLASQGSHVPRAVLATMFANRFRNDLTAGGTGTGLETLTREPLRGIVDPFYEAMVTRTLGAQFLSGLQGNIPFPKMGRDSTKPAFAAENGASTELTPTSSLITLSPKRIPAHVELSKQLLLQTDPSIEAWVRNNLLQEIAIIWEKAVIHGTGSGSQPTGIVATAGIGSVAGGTNGLAPTWANIVDLETALANADAATGNLAYLTNSKVRGSLKKISIEASTNAEKIWSRTTPELPLNGYVTGVSNCVSSTLTKGSSSGVCSAIIFGNFADLVIAQWGGLDVQVNPYSLDTTGLVRITAAAFGDNAVLRAGSFAAMLDALTA